MICLKPSIDKKVKRYGFCNTILIEKIFDESAAILLQNAFPTLEKYIDHIHTVDGKPARVPEKLEKIILDNFMNLMKLHKYGVKVFFTDINSLKQKMLEEIK